MVVLCVFVIVGVLLWRIGMCWIVVLWCVSVFVFLGCWLYEIECFIMLVGMVCMVICDV